MRNYFIPLINRSAQIWQFPRLNNLSFWQNISFLILLNFLILLFFFFNIFFVKSETLNNIIYLNVCRPVQLLVSKLEEIYDASSWMKKRGIKKPSMQNFLTGCWQSVRAMLNYWHCSYRLSTACQKNFILAEKLKNLFFGCSQTKQLSWRYTNF